MAEKARAACLEGKRVEQGTPAHPWHQKYRHRAGTTQNESHFLQLLFADCIEHTTTPEHSRQSQVRLMPHLTAM